MGMRGKEIRLERIMDRNTGRTIIVPLDHGVTLGPPIPPGLVDVGKTIDLVAEGGANAVIGHVGGLALHGHRGGHGRDVGLIMHLSASTSIGPDPNDKVLVNTVTNALKMGADGVSVHINVGADSEAQMLEDLGRVAVACMEWGGMPLLAMMYPRGQEGRGRARPRVRQTLRAGGGGARRRYRQDRLHRRPGLVPRGNERMPGAGRGRGRLEDR